MSNNPRGAKQVARAAARALNNKIKLKATSTMPRSKLSHSFSLSTIILFSIITQLTLINLIGGISLFQEGSRLFSISQPVEASVLSSQAQVSIDQLAPSADFVQQSATQPQSQAQLREINLLADEKLLTTTEINYLDRNFNLNVRPAESLSNQQGQETVEEVQTEVNSLMSKYQVSQSSRQYVSKSLEAIPSSDWWKRINTQAGNTVDNSPANNIPDQIQQMASKGKPKQVNKKAGKSKANNPSIPTTTTTTAPTTTQAISYGEQTLVRSQNAIYSMKNQLMSIKSKHKLLVTKSMKQLQQLDNKLIDGYKLCFKKKMPLYGGMLYRTRDFVIRMAKDVKHEKKVLEAMAKQVQTVLQQKSANKTLVREYNQLIERQQPMIQTSTETSNLFKQEVSKGTNQIFSSKLSRTKKDSFSGTVQIIEENQQQSFDALQSQEPLLTTEPESSTQTSSVNSKSAQPSDPVEHNSKASGKKSANYDSNKSSETFLKDRDTMEAPKTSSKKSKAAIKYTISINEYNLRKELVKSQALIDRIDASSAELTSVVDSIIFLFKLRDYPQGKKVSTKYNSKSTLSSSLEGQQQRQMTVADQRRAKKILKAPIKIFLEKFGKLSMASSESSSSSIRMDAQNSIGTATTIADILGDVASTTQSNSSYISDFKPLFEPSSLVYPDSELGFDTYPNVVGSE